MQMESVVAQDFAYSKEGLEKEFDESMLEPLKKMDLSNIKPSKVAQESRDLDRILASMKDENAQLKSEVGLMSSKDAEKHYDPADEIGYLRDQQANLLSGLKKQEGKISKMFNKMAKTNVGLPKDTETAVGSFEFDEDLVSAKDKKKEDKKKGDKSDKKEELPWYERENWNESDECQKIGTMGEPTLVHQDRYADIGYVCGKDLLAVACDAKTGMDVDFVFVVSLGVVQTGFSGTVRSDAQKQENSVVRSMRITQICNAEDKMKKSKNRCQLEESAWIKGEPMVGKTVDQRRYKIQYQCNYGKRADTKKDYVPTISPPTKILTGFPTMTPSAAPFTTTPKPSTPPPTHLPSNTPTAKPTKVAETTEAAEVTKEATTQEPQTTGEEKKEEEKKDQEPEEKKKQEEEAKKSEEEAKQKNDKELKKLSEEV